MSKKIDLKTVADSLFKDYPDKVKVYVTSDGQGFFSKNHAENHIIKNKLDGQEFFRDGYQVEDNSEIEDLLIKAEEQIRTHETTLNKIQDVANVEAEEPIEVSETDHEAVKAVQELRTQYQNNVARLSEASEVVKAHNDLTAQLAELVKKDETKLAKAIIKLLPVTTEE